MSRNKAKQAAYMREYNAKNADRVNARRRELFKQKYDKAKKEVFTALGGKCSECENTDFRVLQIDHVDGGGRLHRKQHSSLVIFKEMLMNLEMYQLLCANCHQIKTYTA